MIPGAAATSLARHAGTSGVIQGFFPGGKPRILQPALPGLSGPMMPVSRPIPVQSRPAAVKPVLERGVPDPFRSTSVAGYAPNRPRTIQPGAARAGANQFSGVSPHSSRPIGPNPQRTSTAHVGPTHALRPPRSTPTFQPHPAAVQLSGGNAYTLPWNFKLRPPVTGQRLPEALQRKMESAFGTSFAEVRVHVGPEASSIGALAFTHGSNLYFASGQYNPHTQQGQRLLGHELTHVVQQRVGRVPNPLGMCVAVVQDPALEAEAERMGSRAAISPPFVQASPSAARTVPADEMGESHPPPNFAEHGEFKPIASSGARVQLASDGSVRRAGARSQASAAWLSPELVRPPARSDLRIGTALPAHRTAQGREPGVPRSETVLPAGSSQRRETVQPFFGELLNAGLSFVSSHPYVAGVAAAGAATAAAWWFSRGDNYRFGDEMRGHYRAWETTHTDNTQISSRGGIPVNARHNRGAPYLTLPGVPTDYEGMIRAMRGNAHDPVADRKIADDLLNNRNDYLTTEPQQKAAALFTGVIGLAEEWRKQGAGKLARAALRNVSAGTVGLKDAFVKHFGFVSSADAGRLQVAELQDAQANRKDVSTLSQGSQLLHRRLSFTGGDEGYESPDELRKKKELKKSRLFSTKYTT
jgi:Domain of unknown function (DUF4157)